ncbi:porphobilinogen synthase [Desulfallas sp. Bu1-1]|uniref:porphobilinogen synthase n=1 Tax=Desulfallas sp. Bu1-1 TaxID=2787620 RepID=UPI0018A0B851|nr:porphobilinogen synthase [Desulfallas sp. Bu1-1]MBF7084539.1 porphobilinogen synthase [Desulfallas sp. Bu1-1]
MYYPVVRPRRLRSGENMRRLVRENYLRVDDLIYPLFVMEGENTKKPVESMPGVYNLTIDQLLAEVELVQSLGIPGILLFGIPEYKDCTGSGAYAENGIIQKAVRAIKDKYPDLLVITDVCLCEYTDHGHCGLIRDGEVLNDATLELLARTAVSHARAGADMVAPSDMMDGRVQAIRQALDDEGFSNIPVMAYSVKYASAFYGPFREAAGSAPQFGDRKAYQMDPPNKREALREVEQDIAEGTDIIIVKPAMAYMDIIAAVRDNFDHPVAAYNVSGEYSMIKAAARMGWIDEQKTTLELLTGMKRAGADIIITYHALDAARWIK